MGSKTVHYDDLTGVESEDLRQQVPFAFDGHEGALDLTPVTYEALLALLNGDPDGVREVFAPQSTVRRSKTEMDHIRTVARAAVNADGSPRFDVKDTGRLPHTVIEWFENEYDNSTPVVSDPDPVSAEVPADADAGASGEAPTRRGRRS